MAPPVLAIGLDAAPFELVERWIREGRLPVLGRLFARAAHARVTTLETYVAELPWTTFLTGVAPERTGYWSPIAFDPASYGVREVGAYAFEEHLPFYARCPGLRAVIFDVPQSPLLAGVPAVQIRGWGSHSPMTPSGSQPEALLAELVSRFGEHPVFGRDHVEPWDVAKLAWLRGALLEGVRRRSAIARELVARAPFDLFVMVFSESHVAGHSLWHLSQEGHPLARAAQDDDPVRDVIEAIDTAVGEVIGAAPRDARVVVFSPHGMRANAMDLPAMVFLPELLYRMSAPGRFGLADGERWLRAPERPLPFMDAVWARKHDRNPWRRRARLRGIRASRRVERLLGSGAGLAHPESCGELSFQPATWYAKHWPSLPAFALPSFGHGHVRVNLRGRERDGVVDPADYDDVLARISEHVLRMENPRTGKRLARRVWRSRVSAHEHDPKLPDADLVVVWDDEPADSADCGELGRIGPLPFHRGGGHVPEGFLAAAGPGIAAGQHALRSTLDLAPSLLQLAGVPLPGGLDGTPLLGA